jgi:hypothetical protein
MEAADTEILLWLGGYSVYFSLGLVPMYRRSVPMYEI